MFLKTQLQSISQFDYLFLSVYTHRYQFHANDVHILFLNKEEQLCDFLFDFLKDKALPK